MFRRLAMSSVALLAIIGLSACSSGGDTPAQPTPETNTETESKDKEEEKAEEEAPSEQSVAEACVAVAEPLAEAGTNMAELANATSDPQTAVDAWTLMVGAFDELSSSVTNPEVSGVVKTVAADTTLVRDTMQKALVDLDAAAVGQFAEAQTAFSSSYQELITLCSK